MSDLSEQLQEALTGEKSVEDVIRKHREELPAQEEYSRVSHDLAKTLIRSARYHFAGAAEWATGQDAVETTAEYLEADLLTYAVKALASGITVIKSEHTDYDGIFDDMDVTIRSGLEAIRIATDYDSMRVVRDFLAQTTIAFAHMTGFRQAEGKETKHVWDVWYGVLGSCAMQMYQTGITLAQKWREQEVLEGIVRATQSEVSE